MKNWNAVMTTDLVAAAMSDNVRLVGGYRQDVKMEANRQTVNQRCKF